MADMVYDIGPLRAVENEASLPVVWQGIHAAYDRRKPAALLLDRASAGVLDRRAPLDDASDRDGAHYGPMPQGIPGQRARCARYIPAGEKVSREMPRGNDPEGSYSDRVTMIEDHALLTLASDHPPRALDVRHPAQTASL
jgi:hypothetical protein